MPGKGRSKYNWIEEISEKGNPVPFCSRKDGKENGRTAAPPSACLLPGCRRAFRAPGPRPAFPPGDRPAWGPGMGTRLEGAARRRRVGRPRPSTPGRRTGVGRAPLTAPRSARPAARAAIVSAPLPRAGLAPPRPAPLAPRRLALPALTSRGGSGLRCGPAG